MDSDPILAEVRAVRQEHAERFNCDLNAIAADLQKQEQQHPERLVTLPPKPPRRKRNVS